MKKRKKILGSRHRHVLSLFGWVLAGSIYSDDGVGVAAVDLMLKMTGKKNEEKRGGNLPLK